LKILFFGTPEFAVPSLLKIFHSRHQIVGVVTQPDKPKGRGKKIFPPSVKEAAQRYNLFPILQPENLKDKTFINALSQISADVFVVVAFRILPEEIFMQPAAGTINLHPSLLPKYRGAAPINWTVIAGEKETGNTIIKISKEIDAGDIILQKKTSILPDDTAGELHDRLSAAGADLLLRALDLLQSGKYELHSQNHLLSSPAPKLTKDHCHLSFDKPVTEVKNWIHGLSPFPTGFAYFQSERINFYRARVSASSKVDQAPGTILNSDPGKLEIACSPGIIEILELQKEGKKRLMTGDFLRGYELKPGIRFL
jgi:methionyl-tRNA formyltransferase